MSGAKVWGQSRTPELATPFDSAVLSPLPTHCPFLTIRTSSSEVVDSSSRLSKGLAVLQRPTRHPTSRHQTALVARIEQSVPVFPMCQSPSTEFISAVIKQAVPDVKVESIQSLPYIRLQRAFRVEVSDGRTLMLTQSPPPTVRLLRSEQWPVVSNFLVVKWLITTVLEIPTGKEEGGFVDESATLAKRIGSRPGKGKQRAGIKPVDSLKEIVLPYIPSHISNSPSNAADLGSAFHLFEPARGMPISSLPRRLTAPERKVVDFQVGRLIRRLSELQSPNGTFGPAVAVIGPRHPSQHYDTPQAAVRAGGTGSWTNAFHSLLEGILRDGEDMAVTISYTAIRGHFRRLSHLLDAVTISRLVVLDAGDDENILITDPTKENPEGDKRNQSTQQAQGRSSFAAATGASGGGVSGIFSGTTTSSGKAPAEAAAGSIIAQNQRNYSSSVAVTGLWDWSNTVFGDPLFATVFSRETSAEFLRGFRQAPLYQHDNITTMTMNNTNSAPASSSLIKPTARSGNDNDNKEDKSGEEEEEVEEEEGHHYHYHYNDAIIQDRPNAPIRLLLYECYHATVCVVRQFYRPGADSSARELAARRRLAAVLGRLNDVEDAAVGKRPRRASSGDAWPEGWPPGKKARVGGGGGGGS